VHVWLAEGSQDTAARVRFFRNDPRRNVDARILAVSADGDRFTVAVGPESRARTHPAGDQITARTELVFSNVGPGGARLTEGYHVRGWLTGARRTPRRNCCCRGRRPRRQENRR